MKLFKILVVFMLMIFSISLIIFVYVVLILMFESSEVVSEEILIVEL